MIDNLFFLCSLIPLGIISIYEINWCNKCVMKNMTGAYAGILFGFLLYYIIISFLCVWNIDTLGVQASFVNYYPHIIDKTPYDFAYTVLLRYIALFTIIITYHKTMKFHSERIADAKIASKENDNNIYKITRGIGILTFAVGTLCFAVLIISLGGIGNTLSLAETLRQHNSNLSDYTRFYLLTIPAALVEIAPYLFSYTWSVEKTKVNLFLLLSSFFVVTIYFLYKAGRSPILMFGICFLYIWLKENQKTNKRTWLIMFSMAIVSMPLLSLLDNVFFYFNTSRFGEISANYMNFLGEFACPFTVCLNLPYIVKKYGFTYFATIYEDIFSLLPGVEFPVSYENTSEYISGVDWRNTGGKPNDLISFGYIQAGIIGTILLCILVAYLAARLDMVIECMINQRLQLLFGIILAERFFGLNASADLRPILQGAYVFLVTVFILFILDIKYMHIGKWKVFSRRSKEKKVEEREEKKDD